MTGGKYSNLPILKREENALIIELPSLNKFNVNTLLLISSIIHAYEKNNENVEVVKLNIEDDDMIDRVSSAYLQILASYFVSKNVSLMTKTNSKEVIESNATFRKEYNYKEISMENEIKKGSITFYKLEGDKRFAEIVNSLVKLILEKNIVNDRGKIGEFLSTTIGEVFANALNHSNQDNYYFFYDIIFQADKFYLDINVIDFGTTLCNNVKEYHAKKKSQGISSIESIEWAIQSGNTTKSTSGGYGLATLIDYVKIAKGSLIILSDDAYYSLENGESKIVETEYNFPGTVVKFSVMLYDLESIMLFDEEKVVKRDLKTDGKMKINLNDI